ncbi:MAG: FAD-dependent oxidoreductase [Burkholderiaceae bacterium]
MSIDRSDRKSSSAHDDAVDSAGSAGADAAAAADADAAAAADAVDLVVVGSGVSGFVAAIVADALGLNVLLLEKDAQVGGTSALSGGLGWLPGNHHVPPEADPAAPTTYLFNLLGERMDPAMIKAWFEGGAEAIRFLERHSAVRLRMAPGVDNRPEVPGAGMVGRSVYPYPFDDRQLGPAQSLIRQPLVVSTVFHGMQTDNEELHNLTRALQSPKAFLSSMRRLAKHYSDLLFYGRSTRRQRGNALIGMMLKSALDAGIALRVNAPVQRLIFDGKAVRGVVYRDAVRGEVQLRARAVVLATGGFSADPELRAAHTEFAEQHFGLPPSTNVGDGLRMALAIGARLAENNVSNFCHLPVSVLVRPDGQRQIHPHIRFDRCKPGSIVVDAGGRRFVNEASGYHQFVLGMQRARAVPAYLIGDHRFLRKYGMGLARPFPFPYRRFIRAGYLIEAPTLEALAGKLGIDAAQLSASVARLNEYARTGVDLEFHKGDDVFSRRDGDPAHAGPNPCLGPIGEAPFYAVKIYPGDSATICGLVVDSYARVLDRDDAAIEGLYACGMDMNNPSLGTHPASGCNIGPAIAFAYRAARHLAEQADASKAASERRLAPAA